jgi:predicted DNA-binding protein with PD1-like motif
MEFQRKGDRIQLRLVVGEELLDSLKQLARTESLPSATFTALGAVTEVTLAAYDTAARVYREMSFTEPLEMASVVGNISWLTGGDPMVHAHGVFSRFDCTTIAGHIMRAVTSATCEVAMQVGEKKVIRRPDEAIGLNLLDLS